MGRLSISWARGSLSSEAGSQNFTVSPPATAAIRRPSGVNARAVTRPPGREIVATDLLPAASQSRMLPELSPVAIQRPLGL